MKTVITDNSLSVLPVVPDVNPKHIYKYIEALGEGGIKYVEIDFATVMRMETLPEGIGYIFRLKDPVCAELAEAFDFNYVVVTLADLKQRVKVNIPVILELPALSKVSPQLIKLAQSQIDGKISMIRFRGSYPMMTEDEVRAFVGRMKNDSTVPLDLCPMNAKRCALDLAMKAAGARIDNLTMCMGNGERFASIEDFIFSMLSVHEVMMKEIDMGALCKASVYHRLVFGRENTHSVTDIMNLLDYDIAHLTNTDTGRRVRLPITVKDNKTLMMSYISVLEKLIEEEDIPDEIAQDMADAIDRFDASVFNTDILYKGQKNILQ